MTTERVETPHRMTPAEVCRRAAELIRRDGWARLRYGADGRNFCLVGALSWAHCGSVTLPLPRAVVLRVQSLIGEPLTTWNDDPSRTVEDVLAVLDAAAEERT